MSNAAAPQEVILEPDLEIVDPHHHLWDRFPVESETPPHPFDAVGRLRPRYLLDELLADLNSGHNVKKTVFLQCGAMYRSSGPEALRPVGETEFVNGVAAMTESGIYGDIRACAGIVGFADLELGASVVEVLEAHIRAGGGRFRGIRNGCAYDDDPNVMGPIVGMNPALYRSARFREGFAQLAPMGLSFDSWLVEPQLPDLVDLARAFPETSIVLDHVATPLDIGRYKGRLQERSGVWKENLRALAAMPNVTVKLGGLGMPFTGLPGYMASPPATSAQLAEEWRPFIETCIEIFGPQRSMFESNFPVDSPTCTYAVLWNALKRIASGCSADEKRALFSGTASRVYRLD